MSFKFNPFSGTLDAVNAAPDLSLYWKNDGSSTATGAWDLGGYGLSAAYINTIIQNSNSVGSVIKGASGQVADLLQFKSYSNALQSRFNKDGILICKPVSPSPAIDTSTNYVSNGNPFVTGLTGWTATGWTYSSSNGGSAVHTSGNTNVLSQTFSAPAGSYLLEYTLGTGTSGTFRCRVDGVQVSSSATAGTKSIYIICTGASTLLEFVPSSTQTRPIYGVKVSPIIPASSLIYANDEFSNTTLEARGYSNGSLGLGLNALQKTITGSGNIAIGKDALSNNASGSYNLAIGGSCLPSANSSFNVALGELALYSCTTGSQNFGLGYETLYACTTGSQNTAIGILAALALTTGSHNAFFGYNVARLQVTGDFNSYFGDQAGASMTTGSYNSFFGSQSGSFCADSSYCIAIGAFSSFYENVLENYRLVIGNYIYGKGGSSKEGAALGFGINANKNARITAKFVQNAITGTTTVSDADGISVTGVGTLFTSELTVGQTVNVYSSWDSGNYARTIATITNDTTLTLSGALPTGAGYDFSITINIYGSIYSGINSSDVEVFSVSEAGKTKSKTLNLSALPTSSAGLATGDVWNNAGTLKIV